MPLHRLLAPSENHAAHAWIHATQSARLAQSVSAADLGKIAWQQDSNSLWALVGVSPASWTQLSNEGLAPLASPAFTGTPTGNMSASSVTATGADVARTQADRWANVHFASDFSTLPSRSPRSAERQDAG